MRGILPSLDFSDATYGLGESGAQCSITTARAVPLSLASTARSGPSIPSADDAPGLVELDRLGGWFVPRSGAHRRRLHRHPPGAPHQVELEVDQLRRPVVIRLRADAGQAVAEATLQRAEALPL